jgi:tripartite-type tricarboxylate transporter receptor subunit TctC
MAMELLKTTVGLDMQLIPYKGGGPALQDVVSGHVPIMFINQDLAFEQIAAGNVRAIGVASLLRNPAQPTIPTIAEQGMPGFAAVSWNGVSAPAGTPKEIVDRLQRDIKAGLNLPVHKEKLEKQGFVVETTTPEQYQAFVSEEIDKWTKVAKAAKVIVE